MRNAGKSLDASLPTQSMGEGIERRSLWWALLFSLLLHLALLLLEVGSKADLPRFATSMPQPQTNLQVNLLPAQLESISDIPAPATYMPSFDLPLLPDYTQALGQLAKTTLEIPMPDVASEEREAQLLREPSFVPSDFSRAEVNLELEVDIDETGMVRQIRVLSGHLTDAEHAPIFAKVALLQFRPAIKQGKGIASTKIYKVTFNAPIGD